MKSRRPKPNSKFPFTNSRKHVPIEDAVEWFSGLRVFANKHFWDDMVGDLVPGISEDSIVVDRVRKWYMARATGLKAYARYEATIMLEHFVDKTVAKDNSEATIRADQFIAADIHDAIRTFGTAAMARRFNYFDWEDFFKFKRLNDPEFFITLGQWLYRRTKTKSKTLDDYRPDIRIKLYATCFDRFLVPFEFASDEVAAVLINSLVLKEDWPGKRKEVTRMTVQKWRQALRLQLGKMVYSWDPHTGCIQCDSKAGRFLPHLLRS